MKEIQGTTGVHIVLDPQPEDLADTLSNFDLRLPLTETTHNKSYVTRYGTGLIGGHCMGEEGSSSETVPLLTVRVTSLTGRMIDLSVVGNNSNNQGD